MENCVRVRNEQDRQVLRWLIDTIGEGAVQDAARACAIGDNKPYLSMVTPRLGLVPRRWAPGAVAPDAIGEQHLLTIYAILHRRRRGPKPISGAH
ncbi:hypothetical protein [Caballeronia sordidicola]|jgi:hypothetical protein|uniref:hypothetical protein n=1 Tax=Caballeronia sordidicola TaxID=196367 RepID=UPI000B796A9F|nr:hypothetical protein [Caballeronia sordidicola]